MQHSKSTIPKYKLKIKLNENWAGLLGCLYEYNVMEVMLRDFGSKVIKVIWFLSGFLSPEMLSLNPAMML